VQDGARGLRFITPTRVVVAKRPDEVIPALRVVEAAVDRQRCHAVGFIAYEAAAAYGLAVHAPLPNVPLLWFGLYETVEIHRRLGGGIWPTVPHPPLTRSAPGNPP
jgi:para-aminobenzoate synthetase / 4-amino-4-deoxychorismate lyase